MRGLRGTSGVPQSPSATHVEVMALPTFEAASIKPALRRGSVCLEQAMPLLRFGTEFSMHTGGRSAAALG
jgi:hypothetical protein